MILRAYIPKTIYHSSEDWAKKKNERKFVAISYMAS
jgi:hypothetical protein